MKNMIGAALAAALLLAGPAARRARAHDGEGPGAEDERGPRPEMGERMKERLGLTDDQAAKLKSAMEEHRSATTGLRRQERDGMTKLRDLIQDKAADDKIQAQLDSMKATHKQLEEAHEKLDESLKGFLTPTQRAKMFLGIMAHMRERWGGPRGRKGRPGMKGAGAPPPPDGGKPGDKGDEKEDDGD